LGNRIGRRAVLWCAGQYAQTQYISVHDAVVKEPLYASFYNFTTSLGTFLCGLPPVKILLTFAKNRVYPSFEPSLKPYVAHATKYLSAIETHIQPRVDPPANATPEAVAKKAKNAAIRVSKQGKANAQQAGGAAAQKVGLAE
jgi:hypothetical protein